MMLPSNRPEKSAVMFGGNIWIQSNGSCVYVCEICRYRSGSANSFEMHVLQHHENGLRRKQSISMENQQSVSPLPNSSPCVYASKFWFHANIYNQPPPPPPPPSSSSLAATKSLMPKMTSPKYQASTPSTDSRVRINAEWNHDHSNQGQPYFPRKQIPMQVARVIKCHKCNQKFSDANLLRLHSQRHHSLLCDEKFVLCLFSAKLNSQKHSKANLVSGDTKENNTDSFSDSNAMLVYGHSNVAMNGHNMCRMHIAATKLSNVIFAPEFWCQFSKRMNISKLHICSGVESTVNDMEFQWNLNLPFIANSE